MGLWPGSDKPRRGEKVKRIEGGNATDRHKVANAAEMKNVGRRNAQGEGSNRPQLWPAVLLKSINKRRDPQSNDPLDDFARKKKQVAESLIAAKVQGRKVGNGIRRRVRVGVMRVRETVKHVQSAMENSYANESNTTKKC